MEEFAQNFISGDPFTLIAVGLAIFSVVMLFYDFRSEVNSKKASFLTILLLITIALPLTLKSLSTHKKTVGPGGTVIVSNITIEPVVSRTYHIRFQTNVPVFTYLSYDEKRASDVMLPEIEPSQKTDHSFLLRNLPKPIKTITIVANDTPTVYAITIPQILQ